MIGQGAMGTVYVGLNQDTGELIAVKQIDRATLRCVSLISLIAIRDAVCLFIHAVY